MARKSIKKKLKKIVAIFCEGETEKIYFNILNSKYRTVNVHVTDHPKVIPVVGQGQAIQLIEYAKKSLSTAARFKGLDIDQVYIVFDKDDLTRTQLDMAFSLADANDYKILFSNECFDLWVLLHYEDCNRPLSRKEIYRKLTTLMSSINYEKCKADEDLFAKALKNRIHLAMANSSNSLFKTRHENPYTNAREIIHEIYHQDIY